MSVHDGARGNAVLERVRAFVEAAVLKAGAFLERKVFEDLYERWLFLQIKDGPFPRHIGIIPDGNRRWAKALGLDAASGHEAGYQRLKDVLEWIWELGIQYVTVYAMSTENCVNRSKEELEHLFALFEKGVEELLSSGELKRRGVRVKVIGNLSLVPERVRRLAARLEEETSEYGEKTLFVALCYGGRHEILEAVKKVIRDIERGVIKESDLNEETFSKYLMTSGAPDPDLIIRTSGEIRISNFLLWQSAYSELYFCDAYWPEFRKIDFLRAIRSYQRRERRFGR